MVIIRKSNIAPQVYLETATHESLCVAVSCFAPDTVQTPTVLLTHGLAGFVEEDFLKAVRQAYLESGWRVVSYDARYGFGRGEGPLEKACLTHFIEDMATVIQWVSQQSFYRGRYALCAHSLGAGAALFHAIQRPTAVEHLVLLAPVYNGEKLLASYRQYKPAWLTAWQESGRLSRSHPTDSTRHGFISWAHMEDACRYRLEERAFVVRAPTLMIYGDRDISSTGAMNEALYRCFTCPCRMVSFAGCRHTFQGYEQKLAIELRTFLEDRKGG